MREIIEYNLNQLKRLYSAPLLSVHLNMIDGLDDLKIMEECILSEDDARERFFLEVMCRALFYKTQDKYQEAINELKNLDVKVLENDGIINDVSTARKGLIALLLAMCYCSLDKNERSLNWAIRHAKAAIRQFEMLKSPSMRENLVYAMMIEDVSKRKLTHSFEVPMMPNRLRMIAMANDLSIYTIDKLSSVYFDEYLESCILSTSIDKTDPFEILLEAKLLNHFSLYTIRDLIYSAKNRDYEPALLLEIAKSGLLKKNSDASAFYTIALGRVKDDYPLMALAATKSLYEAGHLDEALEIAKDLFIEDEQYEEERKDLVRSIRLDLIQNEAGCIDYADLPDIEDDGTEHGSEWLFMIRILVTILVIRNLYVCNGWFTLAADIAVFYLIMEGELKNDL